MTPGETVRVLAAAARRQEDAIRRDAALAWQIANLSRAKKLPPLRAILRTRRRELSEAEMAEARKRHAEAEERSRDPERVALIARRFEEARDGRH